jgi:N-acetylmuramoyl-L-alanine amidase
MNKLLKFTLMGSFVVGYGMVGSDLRVNAQTQQNLTLSYPRQNHQTTANQIFFIGSASPTGEVFINNQKIPRSNDGHFAPSFPLELGENNFTLRHENETINITITRLNNQIEIPEGVAFANNSLTPNVDLAKLPNELICFSAIAPPQGEVFVNLGNQTIPLFPQGLNIQLPENSAVLTGNNQPISSNIQTYGGCTTFSQRGEVGYPTFNLNLNGERIEQKGTGKISILAPYSQVIEVTAENGVTRTGASTNYSRLTPLPKGTRATVTAMEGEWLRLDYGGWIRANETRIIPNAIPPQTVIRSILSKQKQEETDVIFPLENPVPISIQQGSNTFTLTLYNTVAQTDTIYLDNDPLIERLDWQQITPNQVQYIFHLKTDQQWGYNIKYDNTSLVLSLRYPPQINSQSLSNITVLLDPGHGGGESGAISPNGYAEKDANLVISTLLQQELINSGIRVIMTRENDETLSLNDRINLINQTQPTLALSLHYNALPDNGDAINTRGISTFWYHTQAHSLAVFLENYLVENLNRNSYGVYWNNLALTRPHTAPSVLLELGFLINPDEFEWIVNPDEQKKLARVLANGILQWLKDNS